MASIEKEKVMAVDEKHRKAVDLQGSIAFCEAELVKLDDRKDAVRRVMLRLQSELRALDLDSEEEIAAWYRILHEVNG
jgi:hypothetical protein